MLQEDKERLEADKDCRGSEELLSLIQSYVNSVNGFSCGDSG